MIKNSVLVTGANGYIGGAVAKAFQRAGWQVFGLIRRGKDSVGLTSQGVHPIIGSPDDLSFLDQLGNAAFDIIVSNTEDIRDPAAHFAKVRTMLDEIARRGPQEGRRPLVMFTSGCKDYGKMTQKHGSQGLAPHTENSPMNPPTPLVPRCNFGTSLLRNRNTLYDATILRPTIVYGHSSSNYGSLFNLASKSESVLVLKADPGAVMHSLHVDDCGDAYVSLAEHPRRDEVAQQAFNISNARYETAQEIGDALARSYGLMLAFEPPTGEYPLGNVHSLTNFSQWVASDKLRALTGWMEHRSTFVDGINEYRIAYEAWVRAKS